MALLDDIRSATAAVAARATSVRVDEATIGAYAASLPGEAPGAADGALGVSETERAARCAYVLTLDAINFGSGWFPTLNKRPGHSGFHTIAAGLQDRFAVFGPWSPAELERLLPADMAGVFDQDPDHELMAAFAGSLNALGVSVGHAYGDDWCAVADRAQGSAERLVETLAAWPSFADTSRYGELTVPFFKRAQIAASDLALAGAADFEDLDRLTLFADNLVPHVLRLDGVLVFEDDLVRRIEAEELIRHGSLEEVEIRACAVQAVELLAAEREDLNAAAIDNILWARGGVPRYKAVPRHRARCTAY